MFRTLIVFIYFGITFSSCYQSKEGCMEVFASNYDVSADDNCMDGCCTYPTISIAVSHRAGDAVINSDSTYLNNFGQPIRFKYTALYLSRFIVYFQSDSTKVRDNVLLEKEGEASIILPDDFVRFTQNDFRYTVGEWEGEGDITRLSFDIGIDPELSGYYPFSDSHPLNLAGDSLLLENNELAYAYISLDTTTLAQPTRYRLPMSLGTHTVNIDTSIQIDRGENVSFEMNVDYLALFKDVDLNTTIDVQLEQIDNNMSSIFSSR